MYTAVKPLSKYLQLKSVRIYDGIFTLHAKCTCALLLTFTFLLSSKQYFGDPLVCVSNMKEIEFVNSHCWTLGTYIISYDDEKLMARQRENIQRHYNQYFSNSINQTLEKNLLNNVAGLMPVAGQQRVYLRYYQWVVPVLLLQSLIFYLPAYLWKIWEGGRLKNLCADLDDAMLSPEKSMAHLHKLTDYFENACKETHVRYFVSYIFCEVCNLGISIVNMLLLNVFLDGFWWHYVKALAAVPSYDWDEWNMITTHIFPKIAKCEIIKFGSSGTLEYIDSLCLLPLNILNEKIFAFLWVWFMLMALLAGIKLFYRVLIIFNCGLRIQLLRTQSRFLSKSSIQRALSGFTCSDWFVLMRVSNNISPKLFRKLLELLYTKKCPVNKLLTENLSPSKLKK